MGPPKPIHTTVPILKDQDNENADGNMCITVSQDSDSGGKCTEDTLNKDIEGVCAQVCQQKQRYSQMCDRKPHQQ